MLKVGGTSIVVNSSKLKSCIDDSTNEPPRMVPDSSSYSSI